MSKPVVLVEMQVRKWDVDTETDTAPDREPDGVYVGETVAVPFDQLQQVLDVSRSRSIAEAWLAANRETGDPVIVAEMERAAQGLPPAAGGDEETQ